MKYFSIQRNITEKYYYICILLLNTLKKILKKKTFEIHIYLIACIIPRHGRHGRHGHQSWHITQ